MRVVVIVPLVACYAPVPPSGVECSPTGDCPVPFRCIDGFCGGVDMPPGGDGAVDDDGPRPIDGPPNDVCPQGYARNSVGTCYRFANESKEWPIAEAACEDDGAHLVVVDSETEAKLIEGPPRWVGISDRRTEGTYRAVTGPVIAFEFFAPGQPSGGAPIDCLHTAGGAPARWIDGPCEFPFGYVCEFDGLAADPSAY